MTKEEAVKLLDQIHKIRSSFNESLKLLHDTEFPEDQNVINLYYIDLMQKIKGLDSFLSINYKKLCKKKNLISIVNT